MVKHNHEIQKCHFHKNWDTRVKVWLDQPGRAKRRRLARQTKAARIAPRPTAGALRPAVRCPTIKYNRKIKLGRGFTLAELKAAGLSAKHAQSIGIAVDHRRKNRSEESLQLNKARLEAYSKNLIVFPRRTSGKKLKAKAGDATKEQISQAQQFTGKIQPIVKAAPVVEYAALDKKAVAGAAYRALRVARSDAKYVGAREKRAKEKSEKAKVDAAKAEAGK